MRDKLGWHRSASAYLANNLESIADNKPTYSRALYILASNQRRLGDYDQSYDTLNKFLAEVPPTDPLYDDVLAEIGYYQFVLQGDIPAARAAFGRVTAEFRDRNAFDDALWWLGKIALEQHRYSEAAKNFATISAIQGTNFAERASTGFRKANNRSKFRALSGASIGTAESDFGVSVMVRAVEPASTAWRLGFRSGDEITSICGQMVVEANDLKDGLVSLVDKVDLSRACEIGVDRNGRAMHTYYRL